MTQKYLTETNVPQSQGFASGSTQSDSYAKTSKIRHSVPFSAIESMERIANDQQIKTLPLLL